MLKSDFHLHSKEDPHDSIDYSAKDLIRHCARLKYEVISITHHWRCFYSKELESYAKKQGIILIPGMEAQIQDKHLLVIGKVLKNNLKSFDELEKIKPSVYTIAPHPFYPIKSAMGELLFRYPHLFDAIEHSFVYSNWYNTPIKKAIEAAKRLDKPLIGNTDAHFLHQIGSTYTLIDSKKDKDSVMEALRKRRFEVVTRPLTVLEMARFSLGFVWEVARLKKGSHAKDY